MNSVMAVALQVDQVTIDPSLRLYLPFNEGVGDIAKDYSQYGNNGVIHNAEWAIVNMLFNGTNAHIDCEDNVSLNITAAITIKVWIKRNAAYSGNPPDIVGKAEEFKGYGLQEGASNTVFFRSGNGTSWHASPSYTISNDVWYHIVGVYDGSYLRLYVNGIEITPATSFSTGLPITTEKVKMGVHFSGVGGFFNGTITSVEIYDRGWSALEVLNNYKGEKVMPCNLGDYFRLGQGKLGINLLG